MADKPLKDSLKDRSSGVPLRLQRIMYRLRQELRSLALQLRIDTADQAVFFAKTKRTDFDVADLAGEVGQVPFCELQLRKHSVSFYLYPLREHEELLRDLSPELRARLRGDCCFNLVGVDEILFQELGQLTSKMLEIDAGLDSLS